MSETTDVTSTLAELERKLRELERELASIGRRRSSTVEETASDEQASIERTPMADAGRASIADTGYTPPAHTEHAPVTDAERIPIETTGRLIDEEVEYEPVPMAAGHAAADAPPQAGERLGPTDAQLASLADLRRFRDRLEHFAQELTGEYDALLGRVMSSFSARGPQVEPSALAASGFTVTPPEPAKTQAPQAPPHQETLFEGRVELGVGPFYDVVSLGAFEQRLAELPYVLEVSVRRFEASHAVVDLRLSEPIPLVSELRRVLETDFGVRQVAGGRILLTFDDA